MSARPPSPDRQPWPMKWVVLFIAVSLAGYTFVTFRFRKPSAPNRPYEDMRVRYDARRLAEAGFTRTTQPLERPAEDFTPAALLAGEPAAAPALALGGPPVALATTLAEPLRLPAGYGEVITPAAVNGLMPVRIQFTCRLPDRRHSLVAADLYQRGDQLVIVPTFEPISGELHARQQEIVSLLTLPAGFLSAGNHTLTLAGAEDSRQWSLVVR
jgi:hypothetical protein